MIYISVSNHQAFLFKLSGYGVILTKPSNGFKCSIHNSYSEIIIFEYFFIF